MSSSIANTHRRVEVQSSDLPLIGAAPDRPATVQLSDGAWLPALVGGAIDAHMARKVAAITMGLDHSQMTRQLQADGHLSTLRVGLLPRDVLLDIAQGIRQHLGVSDPAEERKRIEEEAVRAVLRLVQAR